MAQIIKIKDKYIGMVLHTVPPKEFKRNSEHPGKFVLNDKLTAKELSYLHTMLEGKYTYEDDTAVASKL